METLHKSSYYEILLDKSKSLIVHKALPNSAEMSSEDFKNEMSLFLELCEKHHPKQDLVNLVDMHYTIVPADQDWVNAHVFPRLLQVIERMALVVPKGIFESVALEQTMEEASGQQFFRKYFENENNALNWLLQ